MSLLLLLALPPLYVSQAEAGQTGNLRGEVIDDSGLPVPGADVALSGPRLAGQLVVTTDADGVFRVVGVAPGTHTLRVSKSGLRPVTMQVVVRLDETAFVPVTLPVGVEELTVQQELPVIDAMRSAVSTELTSATLAKLPTGRSYQDVVNMIPGVSGRVDTQGGGAGNGNPSVRGEGQYGNNYLVDGVSTRDPATKTFGMDVNYDAISAIQVYTDGAPAEFGQATGMLVNVVTKDGGDEHHGSAGYYLSSSASDGTYDIADLEAHTNVPTTKKAFLNHDLSLVAGGPVARERLWYFASAQLGTGHAVFEGMDPDAPYLTNTGGGFAKLSWFATPQLTVRYQFSGQQSGIDNAETSSQFTRDAQSRYASSDTAHQLSVDWLPTPHGRLEAKALYQTGHVVTEPMSGRDDLPSVLDLDSGQYVGNAGQWDTNVRGRLGGTLSYSQVLDAWLGHHVFKGGAEFFRLAESRELAFTGPGDGVQYLSQASAGLPCTAPDYADCAGYTDYTEVGRPLGHVGLLTSFYLQDDWQPTKSLTLNVGVRTDNERLSQNEDKPVLSQWMPAPRLGAAWDVTGDSKTVVTMNAGRYYDINGNTFAAWADSRSSYIYRQYVHNADTGGYDLVFEQNPETDPLVFCVPDANGELPSDACDGTLRPYHLDKAVVGVKREVMRDFAVGVRGMASRTRDLPEDVDVDSETWIITNPASKRRDYWAVELTAERKPDERWQLLASYTYSEARGTMPGQFELSSGGSSGSDGNQVGVFGDDVNDPAVRAELFESGHGWFLDGLAGLGTTSDDAGYYGYLPYHSFHAVKVNGAYTAPFGTTFGAVYEFDSGRAWQRRGYVELYQDYFAFPEGRGSRFMPPVHYLDLRVAHTFRFGGERSLDVGIDVFNALDLAQAITNYENDDANFGLVLYRQDPRAVRLNVKGTY
jgi:hypothetical protein